MTADLLARIRGIVVSERVQDAIPARIIAEIETTHVLVNRSLAVRAAETKHMSGSNRAYESALITQSLAAYLDPIRHDAAGSDTPEGVS